MSKSKILVVGGTGYVGKRIVKASLAQGHPTYILMRRELGFDIEKIQMLLAFKEQGARLVEGSFSDHQSLVDAVKQVDVVICTMAGVQFRSHNILLQLKLVDAIKEAGNIKRFLPSEFGIDPSRMEHALEIGKETFGDKMIIRKAIEDAGIPHTYISANCFGGYFVGNLSQVDSLMPPRDRVYIYGKFKAVFMDEDDVATYTIKTVDDPRMLNKTLYLRPPENILTHNELVEKWEKLSNKTLEKVHISAQDFLASMKDVDIALQAGFARIYQIYYDGCLMNFEIGEEGGEASKLYPEVRYTRVHEYLKRYL
ncbi:putative oxidoreductase [Helianthus annuus]|nr:putative oxidoreductase [Helianthus annuus]KAJ0634926.1 putative oxidoreductase [Helianthus annuus]KAJ0811540.1 putative oxidoreductase [Helianthus annuus]KAJ0824624.1 putative oxidoreductase [Helianthus annuus]